MAAQATGLVWKGSSPTSHRSPADGRTTLTWGWHMQHPKGNAGLRTRPMEAHEGHLQGWWARGCGEPLAQIPADACGCKSPRSECS